MLDETETISNVGYCHTVGVLDAFQISEGVLSAAGWAISLEDQPLTSLQLRVGGQVVEFSCQAHMKSADVSEVWPSLRGSDTSRFLLRATLGDDQLRRIGERDVVSIVPYVGDIPGIPLERIWPLSYTPAENKESELVGAGDFTETSFSFLTLFRLIAKLERNEVVLDAGCGLGRMAFALAHYVTEHGRYEGFDISSKFVQSARVRYASLSNFRFQEADIYNKMYNADGKALARDFRFPYGDETFSFAFLTSVFTHMLAEDVSNYLREIRRVLRRDGRCLATFFIVDEEAEEAIRQGRSTLNLAHEMPDGCMVENAEVPENAVGYRPSVVRRMLADAGLRAAQFHRGQWPGRARFLTYQDVYLLEPA